MTTQKDLEYVYGKNKLTMSIQRYSILMEAIYQALREHNCTNEELMILLGESKFWQITKDYLLK